MQDEVTELEDSNIPSAVQVRERRWEPPALAQLSKEDFEQRVLMAQTQIQRMAEIQRSIMKKDVDYGEIPGTGKATLFQPGAQVLNRFAGFVPEYEVTKTQGDGIDTPALSFEVRCILRDAHGTNVGEGMGCANTHEKKHRYRYGDKVCTKCGQATLRQSKNDPNQKYYCWAKLGGCGATFAPNSSEAKEIDSQKGLVENPDPHDLANTCLKMGCKRSLIAATVNAHACSGQFAQDDPPPSGSDEDPAPAPQAAAAQQKAKAAKEPKAKPSDTINTATNKMLQAKLAARFEELGHKWTEESRCFARDQILEGLDVETFTSLRRDQVDDIIQRIETWK
jgi:hypothetical protein